jgi:hypothetical protein
VRRLAAGQFTSDQLRHATAHLLENFFESPINELLVSPETKGLSAQGSDLLAQADQTRHMMDRALAERTVTPAQVDKIDQMVRLHAQACVTMPPLAMLRRLVADFNELRVLVSQVQSPTTLVRLYACSAHIGALVADELMVLGETHRAWGWHHSATVAADETGLSELGLQVRSLGILIPLYSDDFCEALSMAVEACELGGSLVNRSSPAYVLAVDRALCLVRKNEINAGCELAADTLSSLPPEHQASIFLGYGKKILAAVSEKYSNCRSVSQYRAVMTESCQAIGAM